ncbi:DUF1428 domain-containing protein [Roseomonas rosulenta]|uniref:DUF1428 domain-containing protein n=1 Tax=Roseomonas rosulenta TaxID=2748667 RepID=UPI0018DFD0BB|nr:DUF1428 domain-containing protein [Roseomonas rosulenta]
MAYVDGFVLAVPEAKKDAYRRHAEETAPLLKEHGALSVVQCWGDDVPEGKLTSFPMAVKREADETIVLCWTTWPSKQARDDAWKRITADPRAKTDPADLPFDGRRMIFGGFTILTEA